MSIESNRRLVRDYYERVVSTGAVERILEFIAPDSVEVSEGAVYPVGQAGARDHILGVRRTYPDLRLAVEQQIAEGEWVVTRVLMRGTHEGEWLGIRPTGQPVEMRAENVDRLVNGRIVEHGGAANLLEPLLKIGAVRVVGPSDPVEPARPTAG
jgi:predicted ester cyclase